MLKWFTKPKLDAINALSVAPAGSLPDAPINISIKDAPEEAPRWKREYRAQLTSEVRIEVNCRSMYGRSSSGWLRQRNGNSVYFDPERPADKILDRELFPIVKEACGIILALDAEYMRSARPEFVDERGQRWRRSES